MPEQRTDTFCGGFARRQYDTFYPCAELGQKRIGRFTILRQQNNDSRQEFAFAEEPGRESWRRVIDQAEVFRLHASLPKHHGHVGHVVEQIIGVGVAGTVWSDLTARGKTGQGQLR